jgi:hypothetical protein
MFMSVRRKRKVQAKTSTMLNDVQYHEAARLAGSHHPFFKTLNSK